MERALEHAKEDIIPSITVGFLVWIFINTSIIEGAGCLLQDTNTIQNMKLPISFFPSVCCQTTH